MKKYIIILFILFLLVSTSVMASSIPTTVLVTGTQVSKTNLTIASTSSQIKKQLKVLNQEIAKNLTSISDNFKKLIEIFGTNSKVGQQVQEVAQNGLKIQIAIKTDFDKLNSRGFLLKLLIGSDKKIIASIAQKIDQNNSNIKQLEDLKSLVKNQDEIQYFQNSIDLITNQNTLLQAKIEIENKSIGIFGWIINLFSKNKD